MIVCGMITNAGDLPTRNDEACGKPARRRIMGTRDGCCDACFAEMASPPSEFEPGELEAMYPMVEEI